MTGAVFDESNLPCSCEIRGAMVLESNLPVKVDTIGSVNESTLFAPSIDVTGAVVDTSCLPDNGFICISNKLFITGGDNVIVGISDFIRVVDVELITGFISENSCLPVKDPGMLI